MTPQFYTKLLLACDGNGDTLRQNGTSRLTLAGQCHAIGGGQSAMDQTEVASNGTPDVMQSRLAALELQLAELRGYIKGAELERARSSQPQPQPLQQQHPQQDPQQHPQLWQAGTAKQSRAQYVRRCLQHRRARTQFLPADLFADPAWDMLLDLYASHLEGSSVSVSSLCIAANVPATTALRWIQTMTEQGLFERTADPNDRRRIFIVLTRNAFESMDQYYDAQFAALDRR